MTTPYPLPFWHFFREIETALSYERWIDKYKILLQALVNGHIRYDEEWSHLRRFMKALYLQDHKDKALFETLLDAAIEKEKSFLEAYAKKEELPQGNRTNELGKKAPDEKTDSIPDSEIVPTKTEREPQLPVNEESMKEPPEGVDKKTKYYHPPLNGSASPAEGASELPVKRKGFLQTDEYFPVTRRQMIKGWQYLRHQEKGRGVRGIDITATVQQIAKDGLFLEPKYVPSLQNRPDTVIIFADSRGSMTPFHELTDRLLQTARGEGGHPRAPVFYFKNYPLGYVYRHPSLSGQVKLSEALLTANRNFTLAVVISDAGAARGNTDPARKKMRLDDTEDFLDALEAKCAHIIWLNPMPVHRWRNTAADLIRKEKKLLMAPLLERDSYDFQNTIRTILKQNHKNFQS